jgi:copper binding plastocyanin/azurin family protein
MRWSRFVALLFAAACGMSDPPSDGLPPGTTMVDWRVGATGLSTTIRDGQFVAWRSADSMHHTVTWTSTPAALDEVDVPGGGTSTAVHFTSPGDYRYSCSIHGATVENGTVHVLVPGS